MASNDLNPRPVMLRRFGYYAFGIAIGFLMLGMLRMGRQEEIRRREAQAAQAVIEAEKARNQPAETAIPPVPPVQLENVPPTATPPASSPPPTTPPEP